MRDGDGQLERRLHRPHRLGARRAQSITEADLGIGQAMADVATVGLMQARAIAARDLVATQLQTALTSRVLLEQAKGMLAQRTGLTMDEAFHLMRGYARSNNRKLSDVAALVIDGSLNKHLLDTAPRPHPAEPPQE
jgi:hypothetical protein